MSASVQQDSSLRGTNCLPQLSTINIMKRFLHDSLPKNDRDPGRNATKILDLAVSGNL